MAHESFEDMEVADYLNQHFISIKVDKEERPDIDSIYMSVCQNLTGSGGWPLSIFMMSDQKPFFTGTYFPKQSRYQMPGFLDLLKAITSKWETDRASIINTSLAITQALQKETLKINQGALTSDAMIHQAAKSLMRHFDKKYGGFGSAPKFPTPHNLMFLLRYAALEQDSVTLDGVEKTLDSMYKGGIFDHIGFGFSRYSTDEKWLVPHFEKMLYDNALLAHAYLDTFHYTKKDRYKQITEMILHYVERELTHPEGGFFCAQDADSEGVEGKYYVFHPSEVEKILGKEDASFFNSYYDITAQGNFEGMSIPNRIGQQDFTTPLVENGINELRNTIYNYRANRTKLHKDDKILTSWNGIMIGAFAKAYKILKQEKYLQIAQKADSFIKDNLTCETKLFVHYRDGKASGEGHIDDYAFYSWALLELYEATLEPDYLKRSIEWMNQLISLFFDNEQGGFYLYSKEAESLIARPKEVYDGAIPSGNSVAFYVLEKIYHLTGNLFFRETLDKQLPFLVNEVKEYPSAYCFCMMGLMQELYPTKELVCVLPDGFPDHEIKNMLAKHFLPQLCVLLKTKTNHTTLESIAAFTKDYPTDKDTPFYYLCENQSCQAPSHELKEIETILMNSSPLKETC